MEHVTVTPGIIDMAPGGRWMSFEEAKLNDEWLAYRTQLWLRHVGLGWLSGPDLPKPENPKP